MPTIRWFIAYFHVAVLVTLWHRPLLAEAHRSDNSFALLPQAPPVGARRADPATSPSTDVADTEALPRASTIQSYDDRNGWFLRLESGISALSIERFTSDRYSFSGYSGSAVSTALRLGHSTTPGFILGVAVGVEIPRDASPVVLLASPEPNTAIPWLAGFAADATWYPSKESGFNLGLALGRLALGLGRSGDAARLRLRLAKQPVAWHSGLRIGYDVRLARSFSLGIVGEFGSTLGWRDSGAALDAMWTSLRIAVTGP